MEEERKEQGKRRGKSRVIAMGSPPEKWGGFGGVMAPFLQAFESLGPKICRQHAHATSGALEGLTGRAGQKCKWFAF